jgi:hypothetical protein
MSILDIDKVWIAALVAQHAYLASVPMPQRRAWNFVGTGWAITDNPDDQSLEIAITVGEEIDDLDARLDALEVFFAVDPTPLATPDAIALRDGTGNCAFVGLEALELVGPGTGLTVGDTGQSLSLAGVTTEVTTASILFRGMLGNERFQISLGTDVTLQAQDDTLDFIITREQASSGDGKSVTIAAGQGATPATDNPGNVIVKLGTPVGGASGVFYGRLADETDVWTLYQIGGGTTAFYFGAAGGTSNGIIKGAAVNLESSSGACQMLAAGLVRIQSNAGEVYIDTTTVTKRTPAGDDKLVESIADVYSFVWTAEVTSVEFDAARFIWDGAIDIQADLTAASLSADQDDYAPTGLATAAVIRLTASADVAITGIAAQTHGRTLTLINVSSKRITLVNDSVDSAASNRFYFEAQGDVILAPNACCVLRWDEDVDGWVCIARSNSDFLDEIEFSANGTLVPGKVNVLSGTATAMTIPDSSAWLGRTIIVKKEALSAAAVLSRSGSDTIDGATSYSVAGDYGSVTLHASPAGGNKIRAYPAA